MAKFRRFWARARGFFKDNFVMLAVIVAALWLLVVWVGFVRGGIEVQGLAAYAMFGTALATLLLGLGTALMARENRKLVKANEELVKQNNISIHRDYIAELIVGVIEPMLSSVNSLETFFGRKHYNWALTEGSRIEGDIREILGDDLELFKVTPGKYSAEFYLPTYLPRLSKGVHQTYYRNFKERNPELCSKIERLDGKLPGFSRLLFELAENVVSGMASNEVLRSSMEFDEAHTDWNEIRLGCTYFTFMKLIGSEEPPQELHTSLGPVDKKAVKCWETNREFLMEEIGKSVGEKPNRILTDYKALRGSLAQIKRGLSEKEYNYRTEFGITDEKLRSIRESLRPSYPF